MASDTAELFFDECRIPARYILGDMNKGFYYIMHNFQGERLAAATGRDVRHGKIGALRAGLWCGANRVRQPVRHYQVWRHQFAEHLTNIEAGRWLTYRALDLMNRGQKCVREITMAKLYTSELSQKVAYDCMQMFGGFGYTTEYPIGRAWRDVRLNTIGAGTVEIMKEIIAKEEKI